MSAMASLPLGAPVRNLTVSIHTGTLSVTGEGAVGAAGRFGGKARTA
jgi:hypothetical protein